MRKVGRLQHLNINETIPSTVVWCKVEAKWSRELETWRSSTYRKDVPWFPEPDPEE
jgi:hypothetical protein